MDQQPGIPDDNGQAQQQEQQEQQQQQQSPPHRSGLKPPSIVPVTSVPAAVQIPRSALGKEQQQQQQQQLFLRSPASPAVNRRLENAPLASPRGGGGGGSQRHPSMSQQALQELLNNPPPAKHGKPEFAGRDWRTVRIGEVVERNEVQFVDADASVEEAAKRLIEVSDSTAVMIQERPDSRVAEGSFDYTDLNAYLLLVVGLAQPEDGSLSVFQEVARKGREGRRVPLRDVRDISKKAPLVTLSKNESLTAAVEAFGGGVHHIVVLEEGSKNAVGLLTQLTLVRFFWENGRQFPALEQLFPLTLRDLNIGSQSVFAISGDRPLVDALNLMNNEGISSLPVLDHQQNVIGNISHVDVRLLTTTTSLPFLGSTCIQFISHILSERGVHEGKDTFPVFHVNPLSTLAHTIAKLVATKSHRMWITEAPSPASSTPPTPVHSSAIIPPPSPLPAPMLGPITAPATPAAPLTPFSGAAAAPLSMPAIPSAALSGQLCGVVSLTDILNLFARASGLSPVDPEETRRRRRRSSSASVRRSIDSARRSIDSARSSSVEMGVGRSASSMSGRR